MAKNESSNLGYLGYSFQVKLVKQLIEDQKFSESIITIIDPNYFDNEYMRLVVASVKNYYEKYETIPSYDTIFNLIKTEVRREIARESANELIVGTEKDDGIDVFHNIKNVLSADFRSPIPTGLIGIDNLMGGGLSKGELGVILAAFGVGKTTLITRMANTAYKMGKNVVQIFFEDNAEVIQRKHYTCFTEIPLNELEERSDEVEQKLTNFQDLTGNLILKRMPSDGTTIPHIRQYLKKLISNGVKPDVIFLDYIDCVQPTKQFKDEFSGEGNVMRQFETMLSELGVAGWTAVQGNRSAIGAELVEANMMGGSIKKGQIGHFILSAAKTLEQKEEGRATLAILKSRFGKDGVVFEDILFDNGTLVIDTSDSRDVTLLEHDKISKQKDSKFIQETLNKKRESFN